MSDIARAAGNGCRCRACGWIGRGRDPAHPPGEFLTGRPALLPQAASGTRRAATDRIHLRLPVRSGSLDQEARQEFEKNPRATFYEIPMIGGMARLGKWFIDSGRRRGTPKADQENVITVYGGTDPWKKRVAFQDPKAAYLILLDQRGQVAWQYAGGFEEEPSGRSPRKYRDCLPENNCAFVATYTLYRELWVPRSLTVVFDFFSRAESLERITPRWMRCRILPPQPPAFRPRIRCSLSAARYAKICSAIQVAIEALKARIAFTETEDVQMEDGIKAKRGVLRSWSKALAASVQSGPHQRTAGSKLLRIKIRAQCSANQCTISHSG